MKYKWKHYLLFDEICYHIRDDHGFAQIRDGEIHMMNKRGCDIKHSDGSVRFVKWKDILD